MSTHGLSDEAWNKYYVPIKSRDTWTIAVNTQHIKSRGTVRLASSNSHDKPLIDPKYFTDPKNYDVNVTVEGIKMAVALIETEAFKITGSRLYNKSFPGCESLKFATD